MCFKTVVYVWIIAQCDFQFTRVVWADHSTESLSEGTSDTQSIKDFVEKKGYTLEAHNIQTEDGYLLTYHRIHQKSKLETQEYGLPVLLIHGLATSSAVFLVPDKNSLGYVLADAGFDVWLANSRGNRYSRAHTQWNPNTDRKFWQFSLDEMAYYDLPAGIDYVLNMTRHARLFLMGHSYGATEVLILASTRPEYQVKIDRLVAFAPVPANSDLTPRALRLLSTAYNMTIAYEKNGNFSFLVDRGNFMETFCKIDKDCKHQILGMQGTVPQESWQIIFDFEPSGTSTKAVSAVYLQTLKGEQKDNIKHNSVEGNASPTAHNVSNINIPVDIFYSEDDLFVPPQSIMDLKNQIPNVKLHLINVTGFNHFDFLWGKNIKQIIFEHIFPVIRNEINFNIENKIISTGTDGRTAGRRKRFMASLMNMFNKAIEVLPVEVHLPGYQYCGPGTDVTNRVRNGDVGINKLDAACKLHDLVYDRSTDAEIRLQSDRELVVAAQERYDSEDASQDEKEAAQLVITLMNNKITLSDPKNKDRTTNINNMEELY